MMDIYEQPIKNVLKTERMRSIIVMHFQVVAALEQRNLAVSKFDQAETLFKQIEAQKDS